MHLSAFLQFDIPLTALLKSINLFLVNYAQYSEMFTYYASIMPA